jgi:hypothetical protein
MDRFGGGQISLAHSKQELKARGERLSVEDFATPPGRGQNAMPELLAAKKDVV